MNVQAEKLKLIEWIAKIQDVNIIGKLLAFKENFHTETDWYDSISENEKKSINRGLEDIKNGKVVPHSEARKLYEKHL